MCHTYTLLLYCFAQCFVLTVIIYSIRDADSLRTKFKTLASSKKPTGAARPCSGNNSRQLYSNNRPSRACSFSWAFCVVTRWSRWLSSVTAEAALSRTKKESLSPSIFQGSITRAWQWDNIDHVNRLLRTKFISLLPFLSPIFLFFLFFLFFPVPFPLSSHLPRFFISLFN